MSYFEFNFEQVQTLADNGYERGYEAGHEAGNTEGYNKGHTEGYESGYGVGNTDGYNKGHTEGVEEGYADGFEVGNTEGYSKGHTEGYESGYDVGNSDGYNKGREAGVEEGYADGFEDGLNYGKPLPEKDINFYDYDGTLLYAWTLDELATATELPELPTHEGLVGDGWNWTLEELREENDSMNVGALYTTYDNKTRIYITLTEELRSPMLSFVVNNSIDIDWGDGTPHDILSASSGGNTPKHEYASPGKYVITIEANGEFYFKSSTTRSKSMSWLVDSLTEIENDKSSYANCIDKIELGTSARFYGSAFRKCFNLKTITMTSSTASPSGNDLFRETGLLYLVIPKGCSFSSQYCFSDSFNLKGVSFSNTSPTVNSYFFRNCISLSSITFPNVSININYSNIFEGCIKLSKVRLPKDVQNLPSNLFKGCSSLSEIILPEKVTSIPSNLFYGCFLLTRITLPKDVQKINDMAFYNSPFIEVYDFSSNTSVPTLYYADTFGSITSTCKILVPTSLYDEWIAATNWSAFADNIVPV